MIVYNERGHRIEDDNIDIYPEDDVSSQNNNPRNNASGYSTSSSHTPVDSHYPPSSSKSRRTSNAVIPDVTRMDARTIEVSKGYTPSIAPSARSATYRGSDGERTGSDSDRRKGKGSYEDRDRGMPGGLSPIEKTASNGLTSSPITRVSSTHSANRNPLSPSASRSPSIKPQSRTQSIHGGDNDRNSAHDIQQPQPIVDEQRHSHLRDNPATPISPRSAALDAILDRPKSGLGVHSRSHTPFSGSRPRTPTTHELPLSAHPPGIARSNTPFIDRPKSGIEGSFFDRPKSAFGSGSIYGDSGPAMFGDSGPAANIGAGIEASLFGDPPASLFGDAHAGESGVNDWSTTGGEDAKYGWGAAGEDFNDNGGPGSGSAYHEDGGALGGAAEGGADENWNTPVAIAASTAEEPVVTTPTTKKEKSKRKNSNAISTPASGVVSRASPALSTKRSLFENTADTGFNDDTAAGTRSMTPIQGSGLLGSKASSPLPLSPLNPASQMIDDPSATGQEKFNQVTGDATTGGETTIALNDASLADNHTKPPTRVPSPILVEEPVAMEKETVVTGKDKKKKKKGSAATTPAKSPHALTQDVADEEKERVRAEQERVAAETANRLAKEEAEQVAKERAEQEKLAAEVADRLEKEKEKAEQERLVAEVADRLAKEKEKAEQERLAAEADRLAKEEEKAEQERLAAEVDRLAREEAEQREKEREEQERLAADKLAEAARLQEEQEAKEKAEKEQAERERLEQERKTQEKAEQEKLEKEAEHDRLEQERLAQEEKEKAAAVPVSAFGSDPPALFSGGLFPLSSLNPPDKPWMSDTGGGDDSWDTGTNWGSATKKKKSKLGAKSVSGSLWGSVLGETTPTTPLADELSSSQVAEGLFSFSSTPPNLSFGFGDTKSKSRPISPVPPADESTPTPEVEANPTDVVSPTAENDVVGEGEPFEAAVTSSKKKKKKGKGANADAAETPVEESPLETHGREDESTPAPEIEANPADVVSPSAENDAIGEEEPFEVNVTSSKKKKKKGKGAIADALAETPLEESSPLETNVEGESTPTPEIEANPTDVVSPTTENDAGEPSEFTVTSKKKKKKGGKGGADAETPVEESSPLETPGGEDETPMTTGGAGNKKKKKKK